MTAGRPNSNPGRDKPQTAVDLRITPAFRAQAGKGRVKGVPNKATTLAKDAIAKAADKLGGTDRLVAWAREDEANERVFWGTIYPKLLPLQVTGEGGGAVQLALNVIYHDR